MWFGVAAVDPITFGGVAIVLKSVALIACYLPARSRHKRVAAWRFDRIRVVVREGKSNHLSYVIVISQFPFCDERLADDGSVE